MRGPLRRLGQRRSHATSCERSHPSALAHPVVGIGAFVGALIMGQAEELSAAFISTPMRDAIAFTILIIVLIVRPTGIFGEPEGEKA